MTARTDFDIDQIPDELKAPPQWVTWRPEERGGKETKVPYSAGTGRLADSTAPWTWTTLARCTDWGLRHGMGIGFVFGADDPFAGVDLDGCIEAGRILPWAWEIVQALDSYTEVSPSGTGLKVIVRGALPGKGNRRGEIEMYDRARFFTITGRRIDYLPATVEERGEALAALHARIFPPVEPASASAAVMPIDVPDYALIHRAMVAKNGQKFARLWAGDWGDYPSPSEADAALCAHLAFWCGGDPERIDRLFRLSALCRPEKWERASYREPTIAKGCEGAARWEPCVRPLGPPALASHARRRITAPDYLTLLREDAS